MSLAYRIVGLVFAIAVGAGLYYGWPTFWSWVRHPFTGDLRYPIMLIYTVGGLWIAEMAWSFVNKIWLKDEASEG